MWQVVGSAFDDYSMLSRQTIGTFNLKGLKYRLDLVNQFQGIP